MRTPAGGTSDGNRPAGPGRVPASHARPPMTVPTWLATVTWALSLAGLAVAAYLTFEHFTQASSFACPESAVVNCVKVTTSGYSVVVGVPVAVAGLAFYVVAAAACSPWAWRVRARWLTVLRLAGAVAGVVFVLYLVWAELFGIGAICLWCTAVHVITALLLFFVLLATFAPRPLPDPGS